tara:strand:- start:340 stop:948 length:609 start_codon:yes stop_codon:yes gene_type:complete
MFIWSAAAHFIALTSPGPDTAVVVRQVSLYGRSAGIKTALGIGFGILFHCFFAVSGISLLIISNNFYKLLISVIGGLYILYLGISIFLSSSDKVLVKKNYTYEKNSFITGMITNIFNIKAFLFFVSLFSILIESLSGIYYILFPLYFSITSALWFVFLSIVLTLSSSINNKIYTNKYLTSVMSFILSFIGIYIIVSALNEYY